VTIKASTLGLALVLMSASVASAQEVPAGTVLPVMLNTTLDSATSKSGQRVTGKLKQSVQLPSKESIPAGAKIYGEVVAAEPPSNAGPARIVVKFDRVVAAGKEFRIAAGLRALASMQDVFEAQLPVGTFDDFGTSPSDWTTVQIGGAAVYHGDGTVRQAMEIIGHTAELGTAVGSLQPDIARGCPAQPEFDAQQQALWLFSPWACGVYGFEDLSIARHKSAGAEGTVELTSSRRIKIGAGSGWLLQVVGAPSPR
jgi:hypothetical protein